MIVWVMLYISLLCYPKIVAKIEICGLHTKRWNEQPHPKRYVKRETHISVLPAKSWPAQSGSNPRHPICKHRWLGVPWITVRSKTRELWAQQVAIHSNIFSHAILWNAIPSWYAFAFSFEYRAGTHQSPKNFPHILVTFTYSTEKHRWRCLLLIFVFCFFRFLA